MRNILSHFNIKARSSSTEGGGAEEPSLCNLEDVGTICKIGGTLDETPKSKGAKSKESRYEDEDFHMIPLVESNQNEYGSCND